MIIAPVPSDLSRQLTYTPAEVAKLLRIGKPATYRLIRSGGLRSINVGRRILIPTNAIVDFLIGYRDAS